jgi:hypothetical protein
MKIVQAALANLPKTLDETYERVFLDIREDDRLIIQHVLHWMSTHRIIHQAIPGVDRIATVEPSKIDIPRAADIPCSILFAAVQQTVATEEECDPLFLDGYVLDEEYLRGLCGCLVRVGTYTVRVQTGNVGLVTAEMPVVSFAHYTVLEFLESRRIRSGPAARFALDRDRVLAEHAAVLLQGAISTVDQWALELPDEPGVDVYGDFDRYCAQSSAILLHWHTALLAASGTTCWLTPAIQLLQARAPYLGSLFWYAISAFNRSEHPIAPAISGFRRVYNLKFLSPPSEPHLDPLVRMLQVDERGHLARALLTSLGRTAEDLSSQVHFEFQPGTFFWEIDDAGSRLNDDGIYEILGFRGSVLEFLAHLPSGIWSNSWQGLHDMLDFAAGHFDPSTILLFVVANHKHPHKVLSPNIVCWGCLVLKKLLQLGARSTIPGYAVGPLQVAAALLDLNTVTILLEAGVHPDDIGDLDGKIGTPDKGPMLRAFDSVRGQSPLNILQSKRDRAVSPVTMNAWFSNFRDFEVGPIEDLLIQYGARSFNALSDPDAYLAAGMERSQIGILDTGEQKGTEQ